MPYFHIFGKFREPLLASVDYMKYLLVSASWIACSLPMLRQSETRISYDHWPGMWRWMCLHQPRSSTCRLHPPRDNVRRSVISHDQFCISQSITISDTVTRVSPLTGDCDGWISDEQECLVISQTNTPACQYIFVSAMEWALHCYCGLSGIRRH